MLNPDLARFYYLYVVSIRLVLVILESTFLRECNDYKINQFTLVCIHSYWNKVGS